MDKASFLLWLQKFPVWLRAIILVLISALVLIASLVVSSCGTMTSATIRNIRPDTNTSITISNNTQQDIDVNADPTVSFQPSSDR